VFQKNKQLLHTVMCLCIENGGSITVKHSTYNLLEPEDQIEVRTTATETTITFVPEKEREDGSGRLGDPSNANALPGREGDVGRPIPPEADEHSGARTEVRLGDSVHPQTADGERDPDPAEGREEQSARGGDSGTGGTLPE